MRLLLILLVGVAVGFGVGWLVFARHGEPSRHDVEQAVLESGLGTPASAECTRQPDSDRIWRCTARFDDDTSQTYRVVAHSREQMTVTPVE